MKALTVRASQVAAEYGEHAPAATACCNTCRVCITSNLLGLLSAAAVVAIGPLRRLGR